MAKVTVKHSAAQAAAPAASLQARLDRTVEVTDALGRTLTLKKPGVLDQLHLIETLGATAKNDMYLNIVVPILYVVAIDGDTVYKPASKRELEAIVQRLDEDGLQAVAKGVEEHFAAPAGEAGFKEALGN
ncbi:hypothetical protein [Paludibacterium paludis]|uniref:Tail assembly chaperone n=1 Tax=Paludibacterium paludis TaxID=1225769 RepID=A0A918NZ16_9NEIS|nr:hypothetical protein [Paludibacterium paludis]GGY07106.1 hypothetical protein GCM10011289_07140 [Paludibacterium paludis]